MAVVPGPQPGQVRLDLPRADGGQVGHPGDREGVEIPLQVPTVRRERVRREATLDGQVVEVAADGTAQGRRGRDARAGGVRCSGQASTSASGRVGMPCASATGP
ncbi:hypothetical protein GCM10027259_37650 [Micromonospora palomenae]